MSVHASTAIGWAALVTVYKTVVLQWKEACKIKSLCPVQTVLMLRVQAPDGHCCLPMWSWEAWQRERPCLQQWGIQTGGTTSTAWGGSYSWALESQVHQHCLWKLRDAIVSVTLWNKSHCLTITSALPAQYETKFVDMPESPYITLGTQCQLKMVFGLHG